MPSKFLKYLSYIKDVSLEKTFSEFNAHLEVLLVNGRHQLITKDAIYSFDDKYDNFYQSFKCIDWSKFNCQKVLVLGLGLGSVIYILEKKFDLLFEYTAVEIDSEIVRMAHKYTLNDLKSFVEVMLVDADQFLNLSSEKYDLILMDIFQSSKVPKKFQSQNYLSQLQSKLNSNGLLLYNRMNVSDEDLEENKEFSKKFQKTFTDMHSISIKDNLIFFSNQKYLH